MKAIWKYLLYLVCCFSLLTGCDDGVPTNSSGINYAQENQISNAPTISPNKGKENTVFREEEYITDASQLNKSVVFNGSTIWYKSDWDASVQEGQNGGVIIASSTQKPFLFIAIYDRDSEDITEDEIHTEAFKDSIIKGVDALAEGEQIIHSTEFTSHGGINSITMEYSAPSTTGSETYGNIIYVDLLHKDRIITIAYTTLEEITDGDRETLSIFINAIVFN